MSRGKRSNPCTARAALLQELRRGPGYGCELVERVKDRSGVLLHPGSAFPALHQMQSDGLIEPYDGGHRLGEQGGRPVWRYRLTSTGIVEAQGIQRAMLALFAEEES